jgi:protein involved in polysaccharide export with SLBB domain
MISRICARLILLVGIAGLAQIHAGAQATLDGAQPQFGTQPAPYATPVRTLEDDRGVPMAQPAAGGYAPNGYAPGGYTPGAPYGYNSQDSGSLGAPDPSKPLGRGDTVTFAIAQDREQPQIMRVTDTGELDFSTYGFPKITRISVAGRTCADVAAELKRKLEADYYYQADVTLGINQVNQHDSRGRVYLTGNVRVPGPEELPANERTTVSIAIIRAGGLAQYADGKKVQLTRRDKDGKAERFTIDYDSIIDKGRTDRDMELQDGDYIKVPQKFINF